MAPTQHQLASKKVKAASNIKQTRTKARVVRYLKRQESQLNESAKNLLLLKGISCSDSMSAILRDLRALKAPYSKLLSKNNALTPFQDETGVMSLEFLCTKNDCSLFAMASHNKKRPNNLVLGRTFDRRLLDMVELHVLRYKSIGDYAGAPKKRIGSKPLMLFVGDVWHLNEEFERVKNLLIDFYRGEPVVKISLSGLDHLMTFNVAEIPGVGCQVHSRTFFVKLKKHPKGGKTPAPFLIPCGPDMDFKIRRKEFAAPAVWKAAMRVPKETKVKKVKNQSTNLFGETIGRLHVESQDIDKIHGKKSKALRISGQIDAQIEKKAVEMELEKEGEEMGKEFKQIYGFEENR